jgi:lipoprotein Spr
MNGRLIIAANLQSLKQFLTAVCNLHYIMKIRIFYSAILLLLCISCRHKKQLTSYEAEHITRIETGKTTPDELVNFACSLAGTPYKYGSTDPKQGFDCSGFVTYVFNHFDIMVPSTSLDFTPVQQPIPLQKARLGDLILFTGTDSTKKVVGHMGIISSTPGEPLRFMHSTSGKNEGVVETDFHTAFYEARYIKTIRIFPQNEPSAHCNSAAASPPEGQIHPCLHQPYRLGIRCSNASCNPIFINRKEPCSNLTE